jgi:hypothetical protein
LCKPSQPHCHRLRRLLKAYEEMTVKRSPKSTPAEATGVEEVEG